MMRAIDENVVVDISGFAKRELNGRYTLRSGTRLREKPTFWEAGGKYFGYFESSLQRWCISGAEAFDEVIAGAQRGWAFQMSQAAPFTESGDYLENTGGEQLTKTHVTVKRVAPEVLMPLSAYLSPAPAGGLQPAVAAAAAPAATNGADANGHWAPAASSNANFVANGIHRAAQPLPPPPMPPPPTTGQEAVAALNQWGASHGTEAVAALNQWGASHGTAAGSGGGFSSSSWGEREGRSSYRERADRMEDRNVQARTTSGPAWASGAYPGAAAAAVADGPAPDYLAAVDWSRVPLAPFQRAFLHRVPVDPHEAGLRRQLGSIEIEEDSNSVLNTPMPIQAFQDLHCIPQWVQKALRENAWETPMPVQAQALPILLGGRNLIGIAQTGSGKTASFLLPAIVQIEAQAPLTKSNPGPVALVLSPTRELAVQISDEAGKLLKFAWESYAHRDTGINSCVFYGGGRKWQQLKCFGEVGSHIVVATPGRLMDFMKEGNVRLRRVTYLVFDEADRMLDLGFSEDMKTVSSQVRPDRQMAFFSATWPKAVQALACEFCMDPPVRIRVRGQHNGVESSTQPDLLGDGMEGTEEVPNAKETILQEVVVLDHDSDNMDWQKVEEDKIKRIMDHAQGVLNQDSESKVLIFVNEKGQVDKLSQDLWDKGFHSDGIHSGRKQDMRLEVLEKFRQGTTRVLVATDVIGRGLDIPKVSHVIIHTMGDVDDYVHRIGRTGRGKDGKGHALVFFEFFHNRPNTAQGLIGVLERAKQTVPPELRKIAESVANGERGFNKWAGNRSWGSKSWGDKDSWKSRGNWKEGGGERWKDWKPNSWKEGDAADRNDRSDRGDRSDMGERSDRGDRGDRSDRGDRGDRSDRGDRGDRSDRGGDRGSLGGSSRGDDRDRRGDRRDRGDSRDRDRRR